MHWGSMLVTPHVSAAWQHAFDDVTPGAALAFASTGIGFNVTGVPLAEDKARHPKIVVLEVASLLGEAIARIHSNSSVSSLFV